MKSSFLLESVYIWPAEIGTQTMLDRLGRLPRSRQRTGPDHLRLTGDAAPFAIPHCPISILPIMQRTVRNLENTATAGHFQQTTSFYQGLCLFHPTLRVHAAQTRKYRPQSHGPYRHRHFRAGGRCLILFLQARRWPRRTRRGQWRRSHTFRSYTNGAARIALAPLLRSPGDIFPAYWPRHYARRSMAYQTPAPSSFPRAGAATTLLFQPVVCGIGPLASDPVHVDLPCGETPY